MKKKLHFNFNPVLQLIPAGIRWLIFCFYSLLFIQLAAFGLSCDEDPQGTVFPLLPGREDVREQQSKTWKREKQTWTSLLHIKNNYALNLQLDYCVLLPFSLGRLPPSSNIHHTSMVPLGCLFLNWTLASISFSFILAICGGGGPHTDTGKGGEDRRNKKAILRAGVIVGLDDKALQSTSAGTTISEI